MCNRLRHPAGFPSWRSVPLAAAAATQLAAQLLPLQLPACHRSCNCKCMCLPAVLLEEATASTILGGRNPWCAEGAAAQCLAPLARPCSGAAGCHPGVGRHLPRRARTCRGVRLHGEQPGCRGLVRMLLPVDRLGSCAPGTRCSRGWHAGTVPEQTPEQYPFNGPE